MKFTNRLFALVLALVISLTAAISSSAYLSMETLGINPDKRIGTNQSFILMTYLDENHSISPVITYTEKDKNPVSTICYSSSNENVATVSPSGKVNTLKEGKCTITVKNSETEESYSIDIIVSDNASSSGNIFSDILNFIRNLLEKIVSIF